VPRRKCRRRNSSFLEAERIPATIVSKELHIIKNKLGLSIKDFAELLKISKGQLAQYLHPRLKTAPVSILLKAALLEETVKPKHHVQRKPTKGEIWDALHAAKGKRKYAAKKLKIGIKRLRALMKEYEIELPVNLVDLISKKRLLNALNLGGNKREAAKILGISETSITRLIDLAGLTEQYSRKPIAKHTIQAALDETRGNRTHAAKLLGISYHGLIKAMKRFNITMKSSHQGRPRPLRATKEDIALELQTADTLAEAAKNLGLSTSGLLKLRRRYGLI